MNVFIYHDAWKKASEVDLFQNLKIITLSIYENHVNPLYIKTPHKRLKAKSLNFILNDVLLDRREGRSVGKDYFPRERAQHIAERRHVRPWKDVPDGHHAISIRERGAQWNYVFGVPVGRLQRRKDLRKRFKGNTAPPVSLYEMMQHVFAYAVVCADFQEKYVLLPPGKGKQKVHGSSGSKSKRAIRAPCPTQKLRT